MSHAEQSTGDHERAAAESRARSAKRRKRVQQDKDYKKASRKFLAGAGIALAVGGASFAANRGEGEPRKVDETELGKTLTSGLESVATSGTETEATIYTDTESTSVDSASTEASVDTVLPTPDAAGGTEVIDMSQTGGTSAETEVTPEDLDSGGVAGPSAE